jgi:hypothetical protein
MPDGNEIALEIGWIAMESARLELIAGLAYKKLLGSDLGEVIAFGKLRPPFATRATR